MDPIIRHRLILLACIAACCAILAPFANEFLPVDRTTGLTLVFSHQGPLQAFVAFALLLVPLTLVALIASVSGTALSGIFVLGVSLCIFASGFGPADGLLVRANLPHDYLRLLIEAAVLACLIGAVGAILALATPRLKARLPWLTRFPDEPAPAESTTISGTLASIAITTPIAAFIAYFLAVGNSPKQDIGAVIDGFVLGAAVACSLLGRRAVLGTMLSPLVLALLAYCYPLLTPMGPHAFSRVWFANELPGLDRILPIFYLAAGPVGAVIGIVIAGTPTTVDQPEAKPA